jgi:hypothetical protein
VPILRSTAVLVLGSTRVACVLLVAILAGCLSAPNGTAQVTVATQHIRTAASSGPLANRSTASRIVGRVTVRANGAPYPGATVEFKNLYGGNVHTTTNASGEYSLQAPDDVYTALALDLNNTNAGFAVIGGSNTVSLPPSARVDFEAYPIVEGYGAVP